MTITLIDFTEAAARLIAEWNALDDDEQDQVPSFGGMGSDELPFTIYEDFSVAMGHHTDGIYSSGRADDHLALAEAINDAAAMLDYDPAEMTTPLKIR